MWFHYKIHISQDMPSRGMFRPRGRSASRWGFKRKGEDGRAERVNEASEQASGKAKPCVSKETLGQDQTGWLFTHLESFFITHRVPCIKFCPPSRGFQCPRNVPGICWIKLPQNLIRLNHTYCDCSTLGHMVCLSEKRI